MLKMIVAACALAILFVLPACTDDGTKPAGGEESQYNGYFYVYFTVADNDCAVPAPLNGRFEIEVEGDSMSFGSVKGVWDSTTAHGSGTSPARTVVIDPDADCYGHYTVTFDVTFASQDSFSGFYFFQAWYDDACNSDSCHTNYTITGSRMN